MTTRASQAIGEAINTMRDNVPKVVYILLALTVSALVTLVSTGANKPTRAEVAEMLTSESVVVGTKFDSIDKQLTAINDAVLKLTELQIESVASQAAVVSRLNTYIELTERQRGGR